MSSSPQSYGVNNSNNNLSTPKLSNGNKEAQLRDNTYSFIQKISTFVHSLSKSNNQQIDKELKTIVYSWNSLCDIYETYPTLKSKDNNEIIEELDNKLTIMIDELKQNHLDKVISIALDLANNAKQIFCTIVSNSALATPTKTYATVNGN